MKNRRIISNTIKLNIVSICQLRISIFILLILLPFFSSCSNNIVITPKTALNLRSQPSLSEGKIIRVLQPGERLRLIEQPNEWIKVKTGENIIGWVHSKYVEEVKYINKKSSIKRNGISPSFLRLRISESWHLIQNYAAIFYIILFITLGVFLADLLGFNPGIGVVAGIVCYVIANMTAISFRMNIWLFAAINAGIGLASSAISGIVTGKNADDNPTNYLIGIAGPISLIIYGVFRGLSQIFIIYICALIIGYLLNYFTIKEFLEDIMKNLSSVPTVIVLMIILSIFSVLHMPKIWPPLVFIQGAMGILGFIAGKNA